MRKSYYLINLETVIALLNINKDYTIYYRHAGYPIEKSSKKKVTKSVWDKFCVDIFGNKIYVFEC